VKGVKDHSAVFAKASALTMFIPQLVKTPATVANKPGRSAVSSVKTERVGRLT